MEKLVKFVHVSLLICFGILSAQRQAAHTPGSSDDTRVKLATMMATMRDNISVVYNTGMSYETFRSKVLGRTGAAATQEGEAVLSKTYSYLTAGTASSQIINSDSGEEMGKAYAKLDKLGLTNEYALFSTASDAPKLDTNIHLQQTQAKGSNADGCKWYQIACWIDDIFGAGTAAGLIKVILALLAK